jgi:DNA-binding transcriptional MerR regulator
MSRLSIKALRLYADQGLLAPAWIDPATGYRYYRATQANQAEAVRILRSVDMPIGDIRELLATDDPDAVMKQLALHRERLEARLADQARMLRFLQRLIDQGGTLMPYDVTIESTPAQQVATWSTRTDLVAIGDAIGRGFATIAAAMSAMGAQPIGNPFVVYHDVIDAQADGTIEICIPASPGGAPAGVMSGRGHVPARCDRISRAVGSGRGGVPGSPGPR